HHAHVVVLRSCRRDSGKPLGMLLSYRSKVDRKWFELIQRSRRQRTAGCEGFGCGVVRPRWIIKELPLTIVGVGHVADPLKGERGERIDRSRIAPLAIVLLDRKQGVISGR